jgi:hypothetical protein
MRNTILLPIISVLLLSLFIAGNVRAQSEADQNTAAVMGLFLMKFFAAGNQAEETRLQGLHKAIDKDSAAGTPRFYVETLARRFHVPTSMIEKRRNKKQGWGEITTQLVMAEEVTQTNPETYPTFMDGLGRIEDLRRTGMGWGKIAQEMRLNLGTVRRAVEDIRNDLRSQSPRVQPKTMKTEKPQKAGGNGINPPLIVLHPAHAPGDPERPERSGK